MRRGYFFFRAVRFFSAGAFLFLADYDINRNGSLTAKELGSHFRPGDIRRLYADAREMAQNIYMRNHADKRSSGPHRVSVNWAQVSNLLKTLLRPRDPSSVKVTKKP